MRLCWLLGLLTAAAVAPAADFEFYGRSGDAIELDFGALPGVAPGASFSGLSAGGSGGHTVLTSSQLGQGNFGADGRLWLFANPASDSAAQGDANPNARGFQGRVEGSLRVNGATKTFAVNVAPGYTGAGPGSVRQSGERRNRSANNELYVAQQQHRLRYLGFRQNSGQSLPVVDGDFGSNTEAALKTFQAAFLSNGAGNVNIRQSNVDGVIGPNTAGWLNAANAPTWNELIDPDPQSGTFSVGRMIGDYDLLPSCDPGGGCNRSGATPQVERFGTDWTINLFTAGSAAAKQATGITQLMNGISTLDGYDSAAYHSSHRAGMDVDIHVDYPTWNQGNGFTSAQERAVIDTAVAFIDAGLAGGPDRGTVGRIITSNRDIYNGIAAARPGVPLVNDSSTVHENHLHIDVSAPARLAGLANLPGDLNLDDVVDGADYTLWRDGLGSVYHASKYDEWLAGFGASRAASASAPSGAAIPEPATASLLLAAAAHSASRSARRRRLGS